MEIEDSYPLTPVQHGMLLHSLSASQAGVYVQQLVCVLREQVDISEFRRAWEQIVGRHAVLRTSFSWDGPDEPVQRVQRKVRVPFEYHDWTELSSELREKRLESFLQSDRQRGFQLDQAPLMRLTTFRFSNAEYRWIWTSHHALLDGRSRRVVLNELVRLYEALCRGEVIWLDSPPPFRAFIDWLAKLNVAESEGFWRQKLRGFSAPTTISIGGHRPPQTEAPGFGIQSKRLSEGTSNQLQSLAHRHGITPNTVLQGAWAMLLSRYTGEDNIVFGATRAGRHGTVAAADSMVGLFINTVPVRLHVASETPLIPWLQDLRSQWIAMRDFEHAPLVKIQQWSDVPAGQPLFESLLVLENYQLNSALQELSGASDKWECRLIGTTNYPLVVAVYSGRELLIEITYDQRRFDNDAITRMSGYLRMLLHEIASNPNRRLREFPLLTEPERHQLLHEWSETHTEYPTNQCIHEIFEHQVERTPHAVALTFESEQLTYEELNRRANQLGHYLRRHGVGCETLVGLSVERSTEMVIGLLGILKAGGAYVPLDPAYPEERLAFMLQDTQAPDLLTQQKLLPALPKTVALDQSSPAIENLKSKIQ